MADHDVVPAAEGDEFFEQLSRTVGSRRHVGVVAPHQFHTGQVHFLQRFEIGLPVVLFFQGVGQDAGAGELRHRGVGRIARIGYEYPVAFVQEGQRNVHHTLLAADQGQDFVGRVQVHAVPSLIPPGELRTQFRNTYVRLVPVRVGPCCRLAERLHGFGRRGQVRAADPQVDDACAGFVHPGHLFQFHGEVVLLDVFHPAGRGDGRFCRFRFFGAAKLRRLLFFHTENKKAPASRQEL